MEAIGRFAGGLAHDFNNLLTPILGAAGLGLQELPDDAPVRARLETIQQAARRAAALTNQMLAYAGQSPLRAERLDLSKLVGEMRQLVASSISGQATLRIFNGAGSFFILQVYLVEPGTDITDRPPNLETRSPNVTSRIPLVPGDYELWVRYPVTATVVAGPVDLALADGGVYGILFADGPGDGTVEIVYFDDFTP